MRFTLLKIDVHSTSVYFRYEVTEQPEMQDDRGRRFKPDRADVSWHWDEHPRFPKHTLSVDGPRMLKSGAPSRFHSDLVWTTQDINERFVELPDWVQKIYSAACAEYETWRGNISAFPKMEYDQRWRAVLAAARASSGMVHGDDAEGNCEIEFKTLYLALQFVTLNGLTSVAKPRDPVTSFTQTVVVGFNVMDFPMLMGDPTPG